MLLIFFVDFFFYWKFTVISLRVVTLLFSYLLPEMLVKKSRSQVFLLSYLTTRNFLGKKNYSIFKEFFTACDFGSSHMLFANLQFRTHAFLYMCCHLNENRELFMTLFILIVTSHKAVILWQSSISLRLFLINWLQKKNSSSISDKIDNFWRKVLSHLYVTLTNEWAPMPFIVILLCLFKIMYATWDEKQTIMIFYNCQYISCLL